MKIPRVVIASIAAGCCLAAATQAAVIDFASDNQVRAIVGATTGGANLSSSQTLAGSAAHFDQAAAASVPQPLPATLPPVYGSASAALDYDNELASSGILTAAGTIHQTVSCTAASCLTTDFVSGQGAVNSETGFQITGPASYVYGLDYSFALGGSGDGSSDARGQLTLAKFVQGTGFVPVQPVADHGYHSGLGAGTFANSTSGVLDAGFYQLLFEGSAAAFNTSIPVGPTADASLGYSYRFTLTAVPLPAALWLFMTGVAAVGGIGRITRRTAAPARA
jgi:hypothetical protein